MERNEALKLLKENVKTKNLLKHMYACETIMGGLAEHFGEDKEAWALAGLLHDIDYDSTKDDPHKHSLVGGKILEKAGIPPEIVHAVKAHNYAHGIERDSLMDKALYCTDPLSGFIVAAALIRPEKKLAAVDVPFLMKRFNEKGFARGANREQMAACSELPLSLEEFFEIGLLSMLDIHKDLGL